jgi:hypothetical protein
LQTDDLKLWFDDWVLKPDDSLPARIDAELDNSRVVVLCMLVNESRSLGEVGADTFRFRNPLKDQRGFIPSGSTTSLSGAR